MNDPCDFGNNNFNYTSFTKADFKIFENCTFEYNSSDLGSFSRNKKVKHVFQFIFYIMASIGNCLLLFVMYKDPLKRFRNSTSYFIINLALADLFSTASGITETVIQLNPQDPRVGDTQQNQQLAACFNGIGIQCSLLMTMIFSLDRYMAIAHSYTYKNLVALRHVVVMVITLPWCFAFITLPVMYFASLANNVHEMLTRILAGNFIALSCVTLTVHPYTHWVFKKRMKELAQSNCNHKQLLEENLKIAKVLTTTVLLVSICLLVFIIPYFVAFCFHVAKCDKCFLNNAFLTFWPYYPLLSSVRVAVNSVVYAWRLPLYRKSLKALLAMYRVGSHPMPGNRIHNFHLHINGSKGSTENDTRSSKDESQSTANENNTGTIQSSSLNSPAAQPMVLTNSGYE